MKITFPYQNRLRSRKKVKPAEETASDNEPAAALASAPDVAMPTPKRRRPAISEKIQPRQKARKAARKVWHGAAYRQLNDSARDSLTRGNKAFIKLSDGMTHYEIDGPAYGRVVVFVHGLSGPSDAWDHNFYCLAEAGYRVIRYDLFGRGYSDRPVKLYNLELYHRQLRDLLDALGINKVWCLTGWSLGGLICSEFVAREPQRINRLALLAPAGPWVKVPKLAQAARVPLVGELYMNLRGKQKLLDGKGFIDHSQVSPYLARVARQMKFRGYGRSILSTLRRVKFKQTVSTYRAIGRSRKPVLVLWGTDDKVVPESAVACKKLVPQAEVNIIDGAGHTLLFEYAMVVNRHLSAFIAR